MWICVCGFECARASWEMSLLAYACLDTRQSPNILQQKATAWAVFVGQLAPHHELLLPRLVPSDGTINNHWVKGPYY